MGTEGVDRKEEKNVFSAYRRSTGTLGARIGLILLLAGLCRVSEWLAAMAEQSHHAHSLAVRLVRLGVGSQQLRLLPPSWMRATRTYCQPNDDACGAWRGSQRWLVTGGWWQQRTPMFARVGGEGERGSGNWWQG